jgi:hypothetical protein
MKLHLPSFLLGYGAGVATVWAGRELRPVIVELTGAGLKIGDALTAWIGTWREDLEDLIAEARARARGDVREHEPEQASA